MCVDVYSLEHDIAGKAVARLEGRHFADGQQYEFNWLKMKMNE